jgi:hypothetical protein
MQEDTERRIRKSHLISPCALLSDAVTEFYPQCYRSSFFRDPLFVLNYNLHVLSRMCISFEICVVINRAINYARCIIQCFRLFVLRNERLF